MNPRKVLITGADGQLGQALQRLERSNWDIQPLGRSDLDIRDWSTVRERFAQLAPDLVIHGAAATNVDRCEREPDWAFDTNALGTRNIAQASALVSADLVYVSTNYVFNGAQQRPYHEFDIPDPISVYGTSKLAGERESLAALPQCFVVRTASVFAERGNNFVRTMLRLMNDMDRITVVGDQHSNPTYASDLAIAIAEITECAPYGTYHVTNRESASWHEWAAEIARLTGATTEVARIRAAEYKRDATPPANGTMTSYALDRLDISLPDWRDALKRCLDRWPE